MLGVTAVIVGVALAAGASPYPRETTLVLHENSFTPDVVTLHAGAPAKLILTNAGKSDHEFQVYRAPKSSPANWNTYTMAHTYFQNMGEIDFAVPGEAEIGTTTLFKVHVAPGARVTLWFTPREKGTFEMASHDPGQYAKGMKGTLIVQ